MSEEEIKQAVLECDKNHDGSISKDEMKKWIATYYNKNVALEKEAK